MTSPFQRFLARRFLAFGALPALLLVGCAPELFPWGPSPRPDAAADVSGDPMVEGPDAVPTVADAMAPDQAADQTGGLAGDLAGGLAARGAELGEPERGGADAGAAAASVLRSSTGSLRPYYTVELDDDAREWVEETLASLSLEAAVGQLVFPWITGAYAADDDPDFIEAVDWVERWGIGGLAVSIGTPFDYAAKLNRLQLRAEIPLLVGSDFENGGPGMRINHTYALPSLLPEGGGTSFPPTMAFGAVGDEFEIQEFARITAMEARAVGVQMTFAPVLDVNSNPDNPIINVRSFGEDPEEVARLGRAYLRGAREGGLLTTAKHFPGHGDTGTDSHLGLPEVTADRARLDTFELVPFRAAVDDGVDAVMTAHVSLPAILGAGAPPATLAPEFLTHILREEMSFRGIIFTDALSMGAITTGFGNGQAAVLALEAGADVLLIPASVPEAIEAVLAAVREGRIPRARIDASVRRILEAKARVGLHRERMVSMEEVTRVVGAAEHTDAANRVASRSITLPRDRDGLIPLSGTRRRRVLSVTYGAAEDLPAGREFDTVLRGLVPAVSSVRIGPTAHEDELVSLLERATDFDVVLVSAYVPPTAGAGSVALPDAVAEFVRIVAGAHPTVLLSFGNPYLLKAVPEVGTYLVAWGDREVSQRAAALAVAGAAGIEGHLPITIPGLHQRGEGLIRTAPGSGVPGSGAQGPGAAPGATQGDPAGLSPLPAGMPLSPEGVPAPQAWRSLPISPLEANPELVGMDPGALEALDAYVLRALGDSVAPGAALAVGRRGQLVRLRGYGRLDWAPGSTAVTPLSIYDLASLTKVVGTTSAVMLLVEEGRLGLDDPVVRYLPEFGQGDPRKTSVTVRDLLLHRSGLPAYLPLYQELEGPAAFRLAVYNTSLAAAPKDATVYSDLGFMALAWIVEEVVGEPIDAFLERRVFRPLGMEDTQFRPDAAERPRIAPTEMDSAWRGYQVRGEVDDENAYAMGGVAGHAGLFSSVRDLAVFAAMLSNHGMANPCDYRPGRGAPCGARSVPIQLRFLDEGTVDLFTHRAEQGVSRALGWDTPEGQSSAGDLLSAKSFGHTGFTGTSIWIDPELELFVVLLTNRVDPSRDNARDIEFRRVVHDRVALAIPDRTVAPRGP
ncbi:MAG: beta-N-acetylglucosaminidase [Gemmatimonadetes bacterium]|nr:beta-N-acetylglucosaminidase [Gemmatimonadota bacterium]